MICLFFQYQNHELVCTEKPCKQLILHCRLKVAAETAGVTFRGYCIKINSFPRVPISLPESGISAPLVIYCGCLGHGHPAEVGVYISHTAIWSGEVMV